MSTGQISLLLRVSAVLSLLSSPGRTHSVKAQKYHCLWTEDDKLPELLPEVLGGWPWSRGGSWGPGRQAASWRGSMVRLCVCVCMLSHVQLSAACQAPLSMGFSRQEYWRGLPRPLPGDLPNPGIELASPVSPALAGRFFTAEPKESFGNDPGPAALESSHN